MASPNPDEISRLELLHAAHPDGLVFPHLADAYRRAGRYTQAERLLLAGLRRHAEYSSAHVVMGRLRLDQGRRDEAEQAFRRVLDLDPDNQAALECLGELAVSAGRLDEALSRLRRLRRLKADEVLDARIAELERRFDGAGLVETNGNGHGAPRVGRATGTASADALPSEEAGEVVTETMAELYARQGLYQRAAGVYRRLLERTPDDARLRAKLEAVDRHLRTTSPATPPPRTSAPRPRPPATAAVPEPERAAPRGPSIRAHLARLVGWTLPRMAPALAVTASTAAGRKEIPAESRPARHEPQPVSREAQPTRHEPQPAGAGALPDTGLAAPTRTLIAITDLLVGLLEYRDPFFRGSSSLTRLLATSVGEQLGLSPGQQVNLALAAVLRDLGRLALGGKLVPTVRPTQTPETRRRIERHVDLALRLLEGVDLPTEVRAAVRHHHERWDGAGYPDALSGEEIPLLARILAVVDSFAAMVSPRPYRLPRKVPDVARELEEEAGTRYDPGVVDALLKVVARREQPHLCFVQRHHILLVNPDQPGAVVTAAKLGSAGYLAEVAADPATARERLRRVPVAGLVVSAEAGADITAAFIRELRDDPSFVALPIVVVEADTVALRVRLLESGADVCFPSSISHAELQGTLAALVRRTLPTPTGAGVAAVEGEAPWLALQGDLQDFPLTWLLQVMKYDSRTAAIAIRASAVEGVIYLRRGDAIHARIRNGAKGESALRSMLRWRSGRFTVQPDARPREETIRASIMHLLLTQAVEQDHEAAGIFGAVFADN